MLRAICISTFLCLGIFGQSNEIDKFKSAADALSLGLNISVTRQAKTRIDKSDNVSGRRYCYEIKSNNRVVNFQLTGEGLFNEIRAAKETPEESFIFMSYKLDIGLTTILNRAQAKLSEKGAKRLKLLTEELSAITAKKELTSFDKARMSACLADIDALNSLQYDSQKIAGEELEFRVNEVLKPQSSSKEWGGRSIRIGRTIYQGNNPSMTEFMLPMPMGITGSAIRAARGNVNSLDDLFAIGLIDNTKLKCARVNFSGTPIDVWMPGHGPSEGVVEAGQNMVLAGWKGGPKDYVLGKNALLPNIAPAASMSPVDNQLVNTFMLDKNNKTVLNILTPFERPSTSPLVLPKSLVGAIFPIAGMDENGRTFVLSWVSLIGNNGVVFVVQYENESSPRLAYVSPSGAVIKYDSGRLNCGIRMQQEFRGNTLVSEQIFWNNNKSATKAGSGPKGGTKKVDGYKVLSDLGSYRHTSCPNPESPIWKSTTIEFVMPRALY